jgi:hypothetical protein
MKSKQKETLSMTKIVNLKLESKLINRALMLTILDNQALILAAMQNKSVQKMREYNKISFESQLEILETSFS